MIQSLVTRFRQAIDAAKDAGEFSNDFIFHRFPRGCCGDAAELLGEYLLENGIRSTYVCGMCYFDDPEEGTQSHAWLFVEGLIADITGDQFSDRSSYYHYNVPDYYGPCDDFHNLFEVENRDVYPFMGLERYNPICRDRLLELYQIIMRYID